MKSFKHYITEVFDNPYKWRGGGVAKGSITPNNDGIPEEYVFKTSDGGLIELTASHFWMPAGEKLSFMVVEKEGHAVGIVRGRAQPTYIGDHTGGVSIAIVGSIIQRPDNCTSATYSSFAIRFGGFSAHCGGEFHRGILPFDLHNLQAFLGGLMIGKDGIRFRTVDHAAIVQVVALIGQHGHLLTLALDKRNRNGLQGWRHRRGIPALVALS